MGAVAAAVAMDHCVSAVGSKALSHYKCLSFNGVAAASAAAAAAAAIRQLAAIAVATATWTADAAAVGIVRFN